jgi:hypothetical protein
MNSSVLPQSEWKAWRDRIPPDPATLHVSGKHTFPTAGYSAELKPASPQGINPKIYILDMMIHKPVDPVIQVPEEVNIEYNEKTDVIYEQVCIRISSTEQVCVSVEEVW